MYAPRHRLVGSLADVSREFICNMTSYVRKIWPKDGCSASGGYCVLHCQEHKTVRGRMAYYRVFAIYYLFLWQDG